MAPKPILTKIEPFYTVEKIAEMFVLHPNQVRLMIKRRELNALRTAGAGKRGVWRIPESAALEWMNKHLQPAKGA